MIKKTFPLGWSLFGLIVLAIAALHPVWPARPAKLTGDFFSHTLYLSFIKLAAALIIWQGIKKDKRLLWWPLAVGLGTFLCVEALKRLTHLPRPDGEPTGFPSGHTMFAFALAWLLSRLIPRLAPLWFSVAICIGWARMEGLAHYPYQVLCGVVLGTILGWRIAHTYVGRPVMQPGVAARKVAFPSDEEEPECSFPPRED